MLLPGTDEFVGNLLQHLARLTPSPLLELVPAHVLTAAVTAVGANSAASRSVPTEVLLHLPVNIGHVLVSCVVGYLLHIRTSIHGKKLS